MAKSAKKKASTAVEEDSARVVLRISPAVMSEVRDYAGPRELTIGEAADKLLLTGISRLAALALYGAKAKKEAKAAAKTAKAKGPKPAKKSAKKKGLTVKVDGIKKKRVVVPIHGDEEVPQSAPSEHPLDMVAEG